MNKEEFLALDMQKRAAVYAVNKKAIDKLFFQGQRGNGNNKKNQPSARNIERQVTKVIGIRQVKRLAYKRFENA